MLDRPCFKPCYSVATIESNQVFLLSERNTVCLSNRFSYLVASLINGDLEEIRFAVGSSDEIIEAIGV